MGTFHLAEVHVRWSGVDDTTPPGCCLANGVDALGNNRLWLFNGPEPTDDGYLGSIILPSTPGGVAVAYGPTGVYVRSSAWGHSLADLLKWLAEHQET